MGLKELYDIPQRALNYFDTNATVALRDLNVKLEKEAFIGLYSRGHRKKTYAGNDLLV